MVTRTVTAGSFGIKNDPERTVSASCGTGCEQGRADTKPKMVSFSDVCVPPPRENSYRRRSDRDGGCRELRPPLSKQVLKGSVPADHTELPRRRPIEAEWRLGVAATGLDRAAKQVRLANGEHVRYDLLLIATGVRARPWSSAPVSSARRWPRSAASRASP
jgi:hypothetical protein